MKISAGEHDREQSIVVFSIPEELSGYSSYELENNISGSKVPVQIWEGDQLVFLLDEPLLAGEHREYTLRGVLQKPETAIQLIHQDSALRVSISNRPVLSYQQAIRMPPAEEPAYYQRGGFIHPVYSPSGLVLSDDFPVGHAHQHSLFMAWVRTVFRGDTIDFWNQHKEQGTVEPLSLDHTVSGAVFGGFTARHRYLSFQNGPALDEAWEVKVFDRDDCFIFDIISIQTPAGSDTLFLLPHLYGGMAFRGNRQWNEADSLHFKGSMQVISSEGKDRVSSNHTRPEWLAVYGPIDGMTAGIAMIDHPDNFRYPQPVRVHPEMPYFCKAPVVEKGFEIVPGKPYVSLYRFVAFDGPPDRELLEGISRDLKNPVQVESD